MIDKCDKGWGNCRTFKRERRHTNETKTQKQHGFKKLASFA